MLNVGCSSFSLQPFGRPSRRHAGDRIAPVAAAGGAAENPLFAKARERGMKIIAIDPVLSPTATKASEWLPIKPGTDCAFILAMIIRTFVVQAFKIPTGSMRPTLIEGDIILVNKFIYGAKIPFTDLKLFKLPALGSISISFPD